MSYKKSDLFTTGMTIFAMFFGAGNIIFPILLGNQIVEYTGLSILGFLFSSVIIPFSGLLAMFLVQGDLGLFFSRIGKELGLFLSIMVILVLGPFGSTPRCIALSYSTLNHILPGMNLILFNSISCSFIFIIICNKHRIISIFGYFLTPILISLLALVIFIGIWKSPSPQNYHFFSANSISGILGGLKQGYNTMDLLAAFFFAPVVISLTDRRATSFSSRKERFFFILKSSLIGGGLLALMYIGIFFVSSFHSDALIGVPKDKLLAVLTNEVLGEYGGFTVCIIIALACMTTAVALISAFVRFIGNEVLGDEYDERKVLITSLIITFLIACFEFEWISIFLSPALEIFYPVLVILTAVNLYERLGKKNLFYRENIEELNRKKMVLMEN